jgi:hypothetical protein
MPVYQTPLRGVSLSEAMAEAMASGDVGVAELAMLEITHPDLAAPLRLVLNDRNVTARLESDADVGAGTWVEWTAINLGRQLPEESDANASPQARFWVDGVSALVAQELELAAASLHPVKLAVRSYLATDLSAPASLPPLRLELRDIEINETRVTCTAAYADFGNARFPSKTFTAGEYPTLGLR